MLHATSSIQLSLADVSGLSTFIPNQYQPNTTSLTVEKAHGNPTLPWEDDDFGRRGQFSLAYPRLELWLWLLNILVHYPRGEIGERLGSSVSGLVMGAYSFVGARSWL
jgi:hypothetical protein